MDPQSAIHRRARGGARSSDRGRVEALAGGGFGRRPPSAGDATIVDTDARGVLGREPRLLVTEFELKGGAEHELRADGVAATFVLAGYVEPGGGPGTWVTGPATLRNARPTSARLLVVLAPAA